MQLKTRCYICKDHNTNPEITAGIPDGFNMYINMPYTPESTVADLCEFIKIQGKIPQNLPILCIAEGKELHNQQKLQMIAKDLSVIGGQGMFVIYGPEKAYTDKVAQTFILLNYFLGHYYYLLTKNPKHDHKNIFALLEPAFLHSGIQTLAPDLQPDQVNRLMQYVQDRSNVVVALCRLWTLTDWVLNGIAYPSNAICCTRFETLTSFSLALRQFCDTSKYAPITESTLLENGIYRIRLNKEFLKDNFLIKERQTKGHDWLIKYMKQNSDLQFFASKYQTQFETQQKHDSDTKSSNLSIGIFHLASQLKILCRALKKVNIKYSDLLLPDENLFYKLPDIKKELQRIKTICEKRKKEAEKEIFVGRSLRFDLFAYQLTTPKQLSESLPDALEKIESITQIIDAFLPHDYNASLTQSPTGKFLSI